ncbi:MAG: PIG-L family deacetylase [Bacteroidia bacterium]
MKKILSFILSIIAIGAANAQAPKSYTSSEILLQLKKLNTVGSVLYIAAHPDDENTRLITYLANEKCLRTGYLSLTRGDGGQNLIGSEQGIELGMIRTQELLAARRIDGGEQFFTRAYDFGFSKNPEETFTKWSHDSILSDMVWVIRNFRPDIIITRFATDGSGGHGHHTASAMLAEEAFDAAADPTRFPEQLQYVEVWKTRRMFWNVSTRFANPNADMSPYIKLDVGGYNPLLGKSYGEIAAESRSMHKSQGFGSAKQRGESFEYFKPIKGDTTGLKDIFEGIDFTWKRVKGGDKIGSNISKIIKEYKIEKPNLISENLIKLKDQIFRIELSNKMNKDYFFLKTSYLHQILNNTQGLLLEANSTNYNLTIDDTLQFDLKLVIRDNGIKTKIKDIGYNNYLKDSFVGKYISNNIQISTKRSLPLLQYKNVKYSLNKSHWLTKPIKNNMFDLPLFTIGDAENMIPFDCNILLQADSFDYRVITPIQYKWVDPEKGELYRPLVITPPVMINLTQKSFVFTDEKPKEIQVIIKAGKDNIQAKVKANLPQGWTSEPAFSNVNLPKKGDEQIVTFSIKPPLVISSVVEKQSTINFTAEIDGAEYTKGIKEIKYDHIPVQTWFPEAEAKLVKVDVKKTFNTVGYIQGAGDEVPASLEQMGYKVVMITDEQLQNGNLNEFPAIVLGVRAFNTNEKLQQYKQRVFDYVKDGGNLIVQYNTNSFFGPLKDQISPVPFKLSRDRVTIEEAPVTFLLPEHPVLNFPNKITNADFEGWIQERGIYFGTDMDSSFQCPLSMNDPGEKPNKGSLIIAKYGKGNYVYTGLAFFRELPAGVPGAYRLFANILSLEKRK